MVLSRFEAGVSVIPRSKGVLFPQATPLHDRATEMGINPKLLTPESFWALDGYMQETVLLSLLRDNGLGKVNELRPDFNVEIHLTKDEMAISFLARTMFKRGKPITIEGIANDDVFAQIYAIASPEDKTALAKKLEHERIRATEEFVDEVPDALFAPDAYFGKIPPARRYYANLWEQVEKEKTQKSDATYNTYTRDAFNPQISDLSDLLHLSERDRRMMDAIDKYERSHGSYWA
ncbi:MAG: hypothetical protein M1426_01340 [Patescibacteria group bacterium]|nr:hypothetical protein [Patescibacteria group bacterium]